MTDADAKEIKTLLTQILDVLLNKNVNQFSKNPIEIENLAKSKIIQLQERRKSRKERHGCAEAGD